ncbi:hypothetical protein LPJ66_003268 [Kickxella alabastrina]|uniref:Uncharacterized protein n=1 Tax=Kickxella alabastrina TaxID=61397 RepID=A0ACC1IL64_9FUNG|nr:hypothetical protein LPJ66_003268 [Kickxella alabastrina]
MSIFGEYPHSITQNGDITLELVYEFLSLEQSTQHQSSQPELHPALQLQPLYPPMLPVSPAISMSYGWSQNAGVSNQMPIAIASTPNSATSQQDGFFENQLWSPAQSYSQNCEVSAMSSNIRIPESMRVSGNRITADFPPSNGNALVSAFSHCGQQEIYGSAAGVLTIDQVPKKHRAELRKHRR